MQNFIITITQENFALLNNPQLGCFILGTDLAENFVAEFIERAHHKNKLILFSGKNAAEAYRQHQADGLIIDTSKDDKPQKSLKDIKAEFPRAIIGAITRNRRHEAMLVSETEPDFIIFRFWKDGFADNAELLTWYNELFLIQNAVLPEEDCDFATLQTDFLILRDTEYKIFVAK